MKRSQYWLGSLAVFSGTVGAQSAVTIYGLVDQGVVKMNSGTSIAANPGAGNIDQWNVKHGAQSRLGFRGTEDLGDGLSAFFQLEHRLLADTGAAVDPFWAGRSVVGLRHRRYGEVSLGRDFLPAFWPAVTADPWGWDTIGQMGRPYTWALYAGGDGAGIRDNNTVQYKSPDFAGFSDIFETFFGAEFRRRERRSDAIEVGEEQEHLAHRQVRVQPRAGGDESDAPLHLFGMLGGGEAFDGGPP